MASKIKLGQVVRDTLTDLEGTVVGRCEWLYGCVRVIIQPKGSKDGKPHETFWVDEPQVEVVKVKAVQKQPGAAPAGPRKDPERRPDPSQMSLP